MAENPLQDRLFVVGNRVIPISHCEKIASFLHKLPAQFSVDGDGLLFWHSGERFAVEMDLESFDGDPLPIGGLVFRDFTVVGREVQPLFVCLDILKGDWFLCDIVD
jgi:hypothetical protein